MKWAKVRTTKWAHKLTKQIVVARRRHRHMLSKLAKIVAFNFYYILPKIMTIKGQITCIKEQEEAVECEDCKHA